MKKLLIILFCITGTILPMSDLDSPGDIPWVAGSTWLEDKTGTPEEKLHATVEELRQGTGDPFYKCKLREMTTLFEQNEGLTFKGAGIDNLDEGGDDRFWGINFLLVRAAMHGAFGVAWRLVAEGASVDICSERGETPLYWAEWKISNKKDLSTYEKIRQMLLDAGADESKGYFVQEAERKRKRQQKDDNGSE